ncbi:MAG: 2-phosphosulfolactate phosphatase, partial [Selenomonadales bacterium]|nr:2-phosphosulfolactate phosphatase [Selenomonadales bacterium]
RFSVEDTLCAGLIADRLSDIATLRDKACAAQAMYQGYRAQDFEARVTASSHGQYLVVRGFENDVAHCLLHDIYDVAPVYRDGIITVTK